MINLLESQERSSSGICDFKLLLLFPCAPCRYAKERVDSSQTLTLNAIRKSLILQEDSIIFNLLLRAQYAYNANTYNDGALCIGSFHGSFVNFIVKETERLHAQVYL